MANMPAAEEITDLCRERPGLGVGVHLNLSEGYPVLTPDSVSSLVGDDGCFLPKWRLLQRCLLRQVQVEHLVAEIDAQVAGVASLVPRVTHVDSHQNVHIFPLVMRAALQVLTTRGITRIRTQRAYYLPMWREGIDSDEIMLPSTRFSVSKLARSILKTFSDKQAKRAGLRSTDFVLVGVPGFQDQSSSVNMVLCWWEWALNHLTGGVYEVVCHPGSSPVEVAVLEHPGLGEIMDSAGVAICNFGDLPAL